MSKRGRDRERFSHHVLKLVEFDGSVFVRVNLGHEIVDLLRRGPMAHRGDRLLRAKRVRHVLEVAPPLLRGSSILPRISVRNTRDAVGNQASNTCDKGRQAILKEHRGLKVA